MDSFEELMVHIVEELVVVSSFEQANFVIFVFPSEK